MEQIHITLPDGSVKDVPKGTTPADIARSISPRLADAALVARVAQPNDGEGELIDLRRPLERDVKLHILTEKDPDSLFVFRHSAAHLLAAAVVELFPNVKLGIGPPIDTGFFYEFLRDEPFTQEDLAKALVVNPVTIYFWEKGLTVPSAKKLARLQNLAPSARGLIRQ